MAQSPLRSTDTLANERTYLAYIRTGLAFVAFGFVVARFTLVAREVAAVAGHLKIPASGASTSFGVTMVVIGILCSIFGAWRYAATDAALRSGEVLSLSPRIAYAGAVVIALIGALVAVNLFL